MGMESSPQPSSKKKGKDGNVSFQWASGHSFGLGAFVQAGEAVEGEGEGEGLAGATGWLSFVGLVVVIAREGVAGVAGTVGVAGGEARVEDIDASIQLVSLLIRFEHLGYSVDVCFRFPSIFG